MFKLEYSSPTGKRITYPYAFPTRKHALDFIKIALKKPKLLMPKANNFKISPIKEKELC